MKATIENQKMVILDTLVTYCWIVRIHLQTFILNKNRLKINDLR